MSWQAYRFEDTPSLSREKVRALREIARLLPGPEAGAQLHRALSLCLQRLQRPDDTIAVSAYGDPAASRAAGPSTFRADDPTASRATEPAASRATEPAASQPTETGAARANDPTASGTTDPAASRAHDLAASRATVTGAGAAAPRPPSPESTSIPGRAPLRSVVGTVDDIVYVRRHGSAAEDGWTSGPYPVRVHFALGQADLTAVIEIPLASARSVVGEVVEVLPERLGASDLLTHVEQGILAFFVERITTGLTERLPFLAPLMPVTILDVVCENCPFEFGPSGPEGWYTVSVVARVAGLSLPFRLALPWAALERARRGGQIADGEEARIRRQRNHWLRIVGDAPVDLRGQIGEAELSLDDLRQLEPTDILLFEAAGIEEADGRVSGRLALASPWGGPRIETEIVSDDDVLQLRIQSLDAGMSPCREEEPRLSESRKDRGGTDPESTDQRHTVAGSLEGGSGRAAAEDTPIQLRVELGRLRLTVRELALLSPGSILEMRRDPSAPVSLLVGDRVIGTGDLVRVEGELGVRIASLV